MHPHTAFLGNRPWRVTNHLWPQNNLSLHNASAIAQVKKVFHSRVSVLTAKLDATRRARSGTLELLPIVRGQCKIRQGILHPTPLDTRVHTQANQSTVSEGESRVPIPSSLYPNTSQTQCQRRHVFLSCTRVADGHSEAKRHSSSMFAESGRRRTGRGRREKGHGSRRA